MAINVTNNLGFLTLFSVLFLILLYFLKPKPFKKVIPSLIFLEYNRKQSSFASFFKRFVKDWMFFIQLFFLLLLFLAAIGLTAELNLTTVSRDVVFVIDASASSNAIGADGKLFDRYVDIARENLGIRNTIILVKDTPEIVARQTNLVNALRILGTIDPSHSGSNVFDAMMMAGQITDSTEIIVLSDFIDTNGRSPVVAKQLLEARGFPVKMIRINSGNIFNVGITKSTIDGTEVSIDVRNFDDETRKIIIENTGQEILIPALSVEQFSVPLEAGRNTIRVVTGDNFPTDDMLYVSLPDGSQADVLFITNAESNHLYSALESMNYLNVKKTEPPIVDIDDEDLYVLSDVDYSSLLPGTIEDIAAKVRAGASLIIAAQDDIGKTKLEEILPVDILQTKNEQMVIFNTGPAKFERFEFGQSSRYYEAVLKSNDSTVIATANDNSGSPVIVSAPHGRGKIFFYGIFDRENPFRLNTQYPLFWIDAVEHLIEKQGRSELNIKTGSIIYGNNIRDPDGGRNRVYAIADETGFYEVDNYEVAANLLNQEESDITKEIDLDENIETGVREQRAKQEFSFIAIFITLAIIAALFEVYMMKRRGDL